MHVIPPWVRYTMLIMFLLLIILLILMLINRSRRERMRRQMRAIQYNDILRNKIEALQNRVTELEALLETANQALLSAQNKKITDKTVFISYKSEEVEIATAIKEMLEQNNIPCFMAPDSIPSGANYTEIIPNAICESFAMVVLLSDSSQKSKWISREIEAALNGNVPVIPYQLDAVKLNRQFGFLLGQCQYIKWDKDNTGAANKELISRLKALQSAVEPTEE